MCFVTDPEVFEPFGADTNHAVDDVDFGTIRGVSAASERKWASQERLGMEKLCLGGFWGAIFGPFDGGLA